MRAVLSKVVGGPDRLVVEEVMDPTPKAGEVVIEVKAVGINYPDTLIIEDKYQFRPERPFSPGAEVAGVVEAVGEGVKGVRKGDRVIAVPGWGGLVERLAGEGRRVVGSQAELEAPRQVRRCGVRHLLAQRIALIKADEHRITLRDGEASNR